MSFVHRGFGSVSWVTMGALVLLGYAAQAADYYAKNGGDIGNGSAIWYSVADPSAEPVAATTAGDVYWIVDGKTLSINSGSYDVVVNGVLCIGGTSDLCPWAKSYSGIVQKGKWMNHKLHAKRIDWYNGEIRTTARYDGALYGVLNVKDGGPAAKHQFLFRDICGSVSGQSVMDGLASESETVNVSVQVDAAATLDNVTSGWVHLTFTGSNAGYKGTISLDTPYATIRLNGDHGLGDPNVPNPAALRVGDRGCITLSSAHPKQSCNRGIRLEGDQAYLMSYFAEGSTLDYPISRLAGVAGKLIKVRTNDVTLDGAYSGGDIEIATGRLIFSRNTVMPEGQNILVRDGATLLLNYAPGVGRLNVTTEGSGQVVYQDGYRQDADGNWEVRVRASVVGNGMVAPSEIWVRPGEKVTLTATDGTDSFVRWSGDVTAAGRGADVQAKSFTIETAESVPSLVANFGTLTKPTDVTHNDGTTYVFADRVLTVTVPGGVVHAGVYGPFVSDGYVTNIVKQGDGELKLAAVSDYLGAFLFAAGRVVVEAPGGLGSNDVGTVELKEGTTLVIGTSEIVASGKRVLLAGTLKTETIKNEKRFLSGCDIQLTGNLAWVWSSGKKLYSPGGGSVIDVAGHKINLSSGSDMYEAISLSGVTITNSVPDTGSTLTSPTYDTVFLDAGTVLKGGAGNVLNFAWDAYIGIRSVVDADWTLDANTLCTLFTPGGLTANTTNYQWRGSFKASYGGGIYGNIMINNLGTDCCLTLAGPILGAGKVDVHGGILNILSTENTYSGQMSLFSAKSKNLRSAICVWDGAVFSAGSSKPVVLSNGDFWIGSNTAFRLPSYNHTSGTCRFYGGPTADKPCGRASLVNFTKSGDGTTLTIDSPVILAGKTDIQVGTLALSEKKLTSHELPVFSNLVFAAGTSFDMHGNDLSVPKLTGFPTVSNAGELTIEDTWTVDYADLVAGKTLDLGTGRLAFSPGAKIVVANCTSTQTANEVVLAEASGGIEGIPAVVGLRRDVKVRDGQLILIKPSLMLIFR